MKKTPQVFFDVSPLGAREFTGISNVTKMLAREFLGDAAIEPHFIFGRVPVERKLVERLAHMDGGAILPWLSARANVCELPAYDPCQVQIGLYPASKTYRRIFPFEAMIVHDLTTTVCPQFHAQDTIRHDEIHLLGDILTSDLIISVSESTKLDIRTYFEQASQIPICVAPMAPCLGETVRLSRGVKIEDYVMVLGTLEPRKNVEFVFQCLSRRQSFLTKAKFVFVGRWGWGETVAALIQKYGLEQAVLNGRIVFPGFVSDRARDTLLSNARFAIYPSRYEGFGLPVVEALSLGTPVLTSYSSSLPEVGGPYAQYFDLESESSFEMMLERMLFSDRKRIAISDEAQAAIRNQFNWARTYKTIMHETLSHAAKILVDGKNGVA